MLKMSIISCMVCAAAIPAVYLVNGGLTLLNESSKIVFGSQKVRAMALEENGSELDSESTTVNVTVKLDYPEFEFDDSDDTLTARQRKTNALSAGKEYYTSNNYELLERIDTSEMQELYVSTYSPFLSFEVLSEDFQEQYQNIEALSTQDYVEAIYIEYETEYVEELTTSKGRANVDDVYNEYGVDGSGITVGLLDVGIVNPSLSCFNGADIVVRNESYYNETVSDHANKMGSIIVGTNGVARGAKMLSVEISGDPISEVDWMLARDVDIINCSFGALSDFGVYNSISAYMDYVAYTYGIIIVAAAGNDDVTDGYVSNPGLGYNVITVGANGTSGCYTCNFSSYNTITGPKKPNLTAPGLNQTISGFSGTHSGTSNSSAFTSACIALLLEEHPEYIGYPQKVNAVLCASSVSVDGFNSISTYSGYGALNLERAFETTVGLKNVRSTGSVFYDVPQSTGNVNIKMCISWLAVADGTPSNTSFSKIRFNFDSEYAGTIRTFYDATRNDGLIEYTIPSAETYVIQPRCIVYNGTPIQVACAYVNYPNTSSNS